MSLTFPPLPFFFLRHGVTDHNLRRLVMGQIDIPLNDVGRRQAEAAARLLAGLGIGTIVCSPLSRARETAAIVADHLGLPVTEVPDLRERDWGTMSGRSYRDLMREEVPVDAEAADAFAERVISATAAVAGVGMALMVAHSGVCRALRRHLGIDGAFGPVPNAIPLRFSPLPGGGWRERTVSARCVVGSPR